MKKIITTLLIFSGIYSVGFAQTKNTAEFGVNIGYNGAGVTYSGGNETSDYTSLTRVFRASSICQTGGASREN